MIDFSGWEMPVQYKGVISEHLCVRSKVGIFDLSHMGEFLLRGPKATEALSYLTTNDPTQLKPGMIQYTLLTKEDGCIVDDILVYRLEDGYGLVVNASNINKDYKWIESNLPPDCQLEDISDKVTLIAVQGPNSEALMNEVFETNWAGLEYYTFTTTEYGGEEILVSRTGYTGEDGFEVYMPHSLAIKLWNKFLTQGAKFGVEPVGLGARDTLRMEVRMPLYGNDIDETTTPLEAGLARFVDLEKGDFIGKEALLKQKEQGRDRRLIAFVVEGKGIARPGYPIKVDGQIVGKVTSGSLSPSREQAIGMGYVDKPHDKIGNHIQIEVRKRDVQAIIIKGRFVQVKK